jgi:hypothetical protein
MTTGLVRNSFHISFSYFNSKCNIIRDKIDIPNESYVNVTSSSSIPLTEALNYLGVLSVNLLLIMTYLQLLKEIQIT